MLPLAFTSNKKAIRQYWDKPIIEQFSKLLQKPLDYFGLPGPDIQDFVDWKDYLGWKTGIEYLSNGRERNEQLRNINTLQKNVMLKGLSSNWELRKGGLEDIILEGADIDGNRPALFHIEKNRPPRLSYSLHNWDFQSGLGYANKERETRRIDALKRCIEYQKNHPFLLLLTINVRHQLGSEPSDYLNGQANELISSEYRNKLEWYSARGSNDNTDRYRTKAIVPLIIRQAAHLSSFDCYCYPPLYYQGAKERLLHYVFSFVPTQTMLPTFSKQTITEVIDLPLLAVENGNFDFAIEQHPGFNKQQALDLLCQHRLPPAIKNDD